MNCGSIKIMVIYKVFCWGTSRYLVGFKDLANFDIIVVACLVQDCFCISCGDYEATHFSIPLYT
jgi:hypothetical protein